MSNGVGGDRRWLLGEPVLVLGLSAVVWTLYATGGYALFWDEYYHLLAARSWAADGTLTIADGVYNRAAWYSVALGWLFRTFGESILLARVATSIVAWLSATVLFLWVRRQAGRAAAWISVFLMITSPMVIEVDGLIRFYGSQALAFLVGVICVHAAIDEVRVRSLRMAALGTGVIALWLGARLTPITLLGVAGLGLWAGTVVVARLAERRGRRAIWFALSGLVVVAVAVSVISDLPSQLLESARWAPVWSEERAAGVRWYHWALLADYPTLWTLLPVAALLSVRSKPRIAWLCAAVFGTVVAGHSLTAAKAERYVAYAMPFFFVLWGVAIAELAPLVRRLVRDVARVSRVHPRWRPGLEWVILGLTTAFLVTSNTAFVETAQTLAHRKENAWIPPAAWEAAADSLRVFSARSHVVVTPNSLQTLYHVGDYDVGLRRTVIPELRPPEEFGTDPRTGRPAISTVESMAALMQRHPTGLVYAEEDRWRHRFEGLTDEVADYVEARAVRLSVPAEWRLVVYAWGPSGRLGPFEPPVGLTPASSVDPSS